MPRVEDKKLQNLANHPLSELSAKKPYRRTTLRSSAHLNPTQPRHYIYKHDGNAHRSSTYSEIHAEIINDSRPPRSKPASSGARTKKTSKNNSSTSRPNSGNFAYRKSPAAMPPSSPKCTKFLQSLFSLLHRGSSFQTSSKNKKDPQANLPDPRNQQPRPPQIDRARAYGDQRQPTVPATYILPEEEISAA